MDNTINKRKPTVVNFKVTFNRTTEYGTDKCKGDYSTTVYLFDYPNFHNWNQIRYINSRIRQLIEDKFSYGGKIDSILPVIVTCKTELITFHNDVNDPQEKYL